MMLLVLLQIVKGVLEWYCKYLIVTFFKSLWHAAYPERSALFMLAILSFRLSLLFIGGGLVEVED